jgi:hypothetical protein
VDREAGVTDTPNPPPGVGRLPEPPEGAGVGRIGWQADGSYVPCAQCLWEPTPPTRRQREMPGVAIPAFPRSPGTATHHADCSTVPQIDQETRDRLVEMDRVRRRGAAEARNFVIG